MKIFKNGASIVLLAGALMVQLGCSDRDSTDPAAQAELSGPILSSYESGTGQTTIAQSPTSSNTNFRGTYRPRGRSRIPVVPSRPGTPGAPSRTRAPRTRVNTSSQPGTPVALSGLFDGKWELMTWNCGGYAQPTSYQFQLFLEFNGTTGKKTFLHENPFGRCEINWDLSQINPGNEPFLSWFSGPAQCGSCHWPQCNDPGGPFQVRSRFTPEGYLVLTTNRFMRCIGPEAELWFKPTGTNPHIF